MLCCTLHSCRSSWHLFQWLHYELEVFCKLWSTESEVSVFSIFHMQTFRSHSAWCHRMNNRFVYYAFMCTLFLVCDLCSCFKLLFSSSGCSCERNGSFPFMGDAQCIIICWAANCCTKLSEMPVEGKREETKSWTNFLRHHSCVHLG